MISSNLCNGSRMVLNIDRRTSKDPRLYCTYCDMNNHPRFACKHAYTNIESRQRSIDAHCAMPSMPHFAVQGLNANKRAKQESRQPDLRWGPDAAQLPMESSVQGSQQHQSPSEDQQPMCAAAAMMHGIPSGAASSWQGAACPPIHEHRQWAPPEKIQATGLMPTSGILISRKAPFVQDLSHDSCVVAILRRALPIQAISMVVLSQSTTSKTLAERHLWRTPLSSSVMQKGFSSKPHVFVYGPTASRIRSWMRLKGSIHT